MTYLYPDTPWCPVSSKGASLLDPPVSHRFPSWSLNMVLRALAGPPLQPLPSVPLCWLRMEVFLPSCHNFGRKNLRTGGPILPAATSHIPQGQGHVSPCPFLPKCLSAFHLNQGRFPPLSFLRPSTPQDRQFHSLDVRRALKVFLA